MKKNTPSIDGFIPRRPGSQIGELHSLKRPDSSVQSIDRGLHTGDSTGTELVGTSRNDKLIGRSDIDESLREIDSTEAGKGNRKLRKQRRKDRAARRIERPRRKILRIIKWVIIILAILAVLVAGYVFLKGALASNTIFKGSILDFAKTEPLKQDANGRSNFLILGTSEDDPGHDASYLTDSMLVVSVDQKNKTAYTFSVPRDLYVQYGMACLPGYSGKINSYFSCVNDGTDDAAEQDRLTKTQAFVGDIVGLDIQYGIHVNYTVMRDVVNAIGGSINITIQSRDPNGQMDSNFDWKCGVADIRAFRSTQEKQKCPPNGHYIDYPNGPVTLDAEHALYLAQARGDNYPTYGFEQSNFDRERNQQKILVAIRDKAMTTGTLTNLSSVTSLLDALGKNLRTNIQTKEVRTLMGLAKDIPSDKVQSIDLYNVDDPQFTTRTLDGAGSVVLPLQGQFLYTNLQAYINKQLTQEPFVKEKPHVTVLNGSGTAGRAQAEADKLTALGFVVDVVENAPDGTYTKTEVYQINTKKPETSAKLTSLYSITLKTTAPPVSVVGTTDFVIIIGTAQ